jgi:hypothetical protein
MLNRTLALAGALVLALTFPAWGWSNKEHLQLTRIAALRLVNSPDTPADMKAWLREAMPGMTDMEAEKQFFLNARVGPYPIGAQGLSFWATVPDLDVATAKQGREEKIEPFGAPERLMHYIDIEFFNPDESKRVYSDDLSTKPTVDDVPHDYKDPRWQRSGYLPFRVEQCYGEFVKQLKAGRLVSKPGQFPRDEHAMKWAGFLAHYLEDNTQPQHATIDFQSKTYFKNKRGAPNVHADVEYRLVDDDKDDYMAVREQLWNEFVKALDEVKDPVQTEDLFRATVEVSLTSYDALPMIGHAAVAAYGSDTTPGEFDAAKFARFKGKYLGREMTISEMKAHQLAWAVKRVERVWLRAWKEAHGG